MPVYLTLPSSNYTQKIVDPQNKLLRQKEIQHIKAEPLVLGRLNQIKNVFVVLTYFKEFLPQYSIFLIPILCILIV